MNKKTLIIGTALGLISTTYSLIFEKQLISGANQFMGYIPIVFPVIGFVYLILDVKNSQNGYILFKEGFLPAFIAGAISTIIGSVASYFNLFVIKSKAQLDEIIKIMADNMIQKGIPESQAVQVATSTFSPWMILVGLGSGLLMSAVIAAILAGILAKKKDTEL